MTNSACKNVGVGHKTDRGHDDHGRGNGYGHCDPEPTPTPVPDPEPTPTPVPTPTPTPTPEVTPTPQLGGDTHTVPIQGTLLLVPILVVAVAMWFRGGIGGPKPPK